MSLGVAALLLLSLLGPAGPGAAAPPGGVAVFAFLPARVLTAPGLGTVAVGMPDRRTVEVQRLDSATGAWSRPRAVYHSRGRVTCGRIDARTSPGGVALTVECDAPTTTTRPRRAARR